MARSVLITGTDRGLGPCLVQKFVQEGWRVFSGKRSLVRANRPPQVISDSLTEVGLDVSDLGSVQRAAGAVAERSQGLDLLINNAAINPDCDVALESLDFDTILDTLNVNSLGPLRMAQAFLPLLERGERKIIANISSEAGSVANAGRDKCYGYCMSKAALNMQSRILDKALAPRGFIVLAIHPGWMRTPMGGATARLDPRESATGIFDLLSDAKPSMPRFVQQDGTPYPW